MFEGDVVEYEFVQSPLALVALMADSESGRWPTVVRMEAARHKRRVACLD